MLRSIGIALALAFVSFAPAVAQEVTAETPDPGQTEMRRVSQILGSTVKLNDGSGFGKVEDIMIGPDNRIEYLVVAHEQQFAMFPWSAGQYNPTQRIVTYGVAPTALGPVLFARNAWPTGPVYYNRVRTIFPRPIAPAGAVVPGNEKVKVKRDGTVKVKP